MKVMALDGNSLAYRAFYALPEDMANASGQVTNAVYGFTTMLLNLAKEHSPDAILVVFDRPEPTFRHVAIPEYKAQREKAPDTLFQQLGMLRQLLDDMGIAWMELPGFEGDDLIATVAKKASELGHDVVPPRTNLPLPRSLQPFRSPDAPPRRATLRKPDRPLPPDGLDTVYQAKVKRRRATGRCRP
jgi:hypothetical protein